MDVPLLASRFIVEVGDRAVPVSEVRGLAYALGLELGAMAPEIAYEELVLAVDRVVLR